VTVAGEAEVVATRRTENVFKLPDGATTITFHRSDDGSVNVATVNHGADYEVQRILPFQVDSRQLADVEGWYFSPALGTGYTFTVRDGTLMASHPRRGEFELTATAPDQFAGGPTWFASATFTRGEHGTVTGVIATGEGVSGVMFNRVELP